MRTPALRPVQEGGPEDKKVKLACLRWLNACMDHPTRELHMAMSTAKLLNGCPSFEELDAARLGDSFLEAFRANHSSSDLFFGG